MAHTTGSPGHEILDRPAKLRSASSPKPRSKIVAGSGITPVLSLVATALATEPASRFTVIYGNRYSRSVMFAEELAGGTGK